MNRAIARICAWDATRPRPSMHRRTPKSLGLPYIDVNFPSAHADRIGLSGWLIPSSAGASKAAVILCHGHTSTRSDMLHKAALLHEHHFTTLLFDFRARGMSEGHLCTLGSRETDDVLGAVMFLGSRSDTKDLQIGALGESMGGAAIIQAAALSPAIRCVVAEASFATLTGAVKQRISLMLGPIAKSVIHVCHTIARTEFDVEIGTVEPARAIAAISPRPVMLITDGLDLTCPRSESDRLYAAAGEPKERWIVSTAPHVGAFYAARGAYSRKVPDFFNRRLGRSGSDATSGPAST